MSTRRLFVALWPDLVVREQIARLQKQVSVLTGLTQAAVAFENLHMTLRFLGSVQATDIESLKASLNTVDSQPFILKLDSWGQFPKPGIHWLGPGASPAELLNCQQQVATVCNGVGQQQKEKGFRPHITLYRKVHHLQELMAFDAIEWLVDRVVLVESDTHPDGVRYKVLSEFLFD